MSQISWLAPIATARLDARVEIPGSKSLTNRLLVLAALAKGPGIIRGALRSRDTNLMITALRQLGVGIAEGDDPTTLIVRPLLGHRWPEESEAEGDEGEVRKRCGIGGKDSGEIASNANEVQIDVGLAGTVMRFLPAVAALTPFTVHFVGDPAATVRPMKPLLDALRSLGVQITGDALPFSVSGAGKVSGGAVSIDASSSSQFVSGLLLAAPRYDSGLKLTAVGQVPSLPHLEMTVAELCACGVQVSATGGHDWVVMPGEIASRDVRIEPDLSNAAPFLAAALVAGGRVVIPGWPHNTSQPGALVPDLLRQMGGEVNLQDDELVVTGSGRILGITADLSAAGELTPTIAALAALAETPSQLTGIAHLRGHETDRLAALVAEINRLGGNAQELSDGIAIAPVSLHGGTWESYADHRMATAGAIIGLRIPNVTVSDIATTAKTLPGFDRMWAQMLNSITGSGPAEITAVSSMAVSSMATRSTPAGRATGVQVGHTTEETNANHGQRPDTTNGQEV